MTGDSRKSTRQKELGAFYTQEAVAQFLVWWAIRSPQDRVLDPSFGGGIFLKTAAHRIRALRGVPAEHIFGIEVDPDVYHRISSEISDDLGRPATGLHREDFFRTAPEVIGRVDAVVGNPPFIRYQRFSGDTRSRAMALAAAHGVHLTDLASSWAPFLIHSVDFLRPGGRLAMVVPAELMHAAYALPVLRFLTRSFQRITFLSFRKRLFPELSQDTMLLLADNKGEHAAQVRHRDLASSDLLATLADKGDLSVRATRRIDPDRLSSGDERLIEHLIPRKARELYNLLKKHPLVRRVGDVADVGIGYVTGSNDFFHVGPSQAESLGIPAGYLRRAVKRGRALQGLCFREADWDAAAATGDAGYLLFIPPTTKDLPHSIRDYLTHGERLGVPQAYKCRTRKAWYSVPHVYHPDAFLTYMSGISPRLVVNDIAAVAPNTLHVVRMHPIPGMDAHQLALSWPSSLTQLSVEIEGHALGGGMLKIEPTEAENVLIAAHPHAGPLSRETARVLDTMMRKAGDSIVHAAVDRACLKDALGLDDHDIRLLRDTAGQLRARRYTRGAVA